MKCSPRLRPGSFGGAGVSACAGSQLGAIFASAPQDAVKAHGRHEIIAEALRTKAQHGDEFLPEGSWGGWGNRHCADSRGGHARQTGNERPWHRVEGELILARSAPGPMPGMGCSCVGMRGSPSLVRPTIAAASCSWPPHHRRRIARG